MTYSLNNKTKVEDENRNLLHWFRQFKKKKKNTQKPQLGIADLIENDIIWDAIKIVQQFRLGF